MRPADRRRPLLVALRPLGLGDLLTGVPALRALARAFPMHERILACPTGLEPLALAIGGVDRVVNTQPLVPLSPALRGADIAVDMHGKGPASQRILLASGLAGSLPLGTRMFRRLRGCRNGARRSTR